MSSEKTTLNWMQVGENQWRAEKTVNSMAYELFYGWNGDDESFLVEVVCTLAMPCADFEELHIDHTQEYSCVNTVSTFEEIEPKIMLTIHKLSEYVKGKTGNV